MVVTVPQIRHAQDTVRRTTAIIGDSAKRTEHFINIVKKNSPLTTRAHLFTLCATRFVRSSATNPLWHFYVCLLI